MLIYSLRNLIIGYTITIIVVLLILLYTFSTLRSQEKKLGKIQRSREALQVLGPSLVNMQEFEADLFSYINSGDKQELNFYKDDTNKLTSDSLQLVLVAAAIHDTGIVSAYRQLISLQREMKDYAVLVLDLNRTKSDDIAKAKLNNGTGSRIVKTFKSVADKLEDYNRRIISTSYSDTISLTRKTFAFVKAIAAILIIILLISFYFHYSDIKKREKAEIQLKKFNEELERQVNEKTSEIRKNEQQLKLIYNTTTDIIFLISIDEERQYKFSSVNQAFLSVTGLKEEQLVGKHIKEVIPEPSLSVVLEKYSEAIQMRKPIYWEETSDYPSGRKTGIVTVNPVFNEQGECTMLVGAVHDITERKKAEQELVEAESKFRNLVEQSLIGVYIIQNGKLAYVNPQFAKIFGYTQEELINYNPLEVILPDDRIMVAENVRSRVEGEKDSVHYEANGLKKDGELIRVEVFCNGTLFEGSSAIIGTILDITERKKAEKEIIKANERFNLIARATNDAVWDWDMINDRNWGNEIFYKYYGIEPGSLSNNETFLSRVNPADKERLLAKLQKTIDNKEEVVVDEFHFRMPDGNYRYFYDRAYIIYDAEGKPVRMLGSMMDMTNIKKAEEEKERARHLLNERVKELTTLYQSGQILQMEYRPIEEVLQEIVSVIPSGWQYPGITAARITLGEMEFITHNFATGPHRQNAAFIAPDGKTGKIEVVYLEQKPDEQEGAFLAEERDLINMLAEMLRVYLARKRATDELMKSEANLKTIFETTDDGYALLDINFNIVSYNQRGFDFVVNELGGKPGTSNNLIDYIPQERRSFLLNLKEEVIKGKNVNYEVSYKQPDNSYKWYNIRMFSITNSEKKILGLMIAASNITEKKLMEQEMLNQKVQEQKKIIRAVLKAEEKERNKIGQELHDNVNQILAGTKLYLSMASTNKVDEKNLIKSSMELIDTAIEEIRSLSKSQVTPLKGVDMEELINSLVDKLNNTSPVKTFLLYDVNSQVIEDDLKLNIYRIVQEQTNNILKHADASNVRISIKEDYEFLYVSVEDDGKGFDSSQKRNGIGVSNMINRVESFNGEFVLDSSPGNGCRLTIRMPY